MEHIHTTASAVENMRRAAKKRVAATHLSLSACLNEVAKENGYDHWKHVTTCRHLTDRQSSFPPFYNGVTYPDGTTDTPHFGASHDDSAHERTLGALIDKTPIPEIDAMEIDGVRSGFEATEAETSAGVLPIKGKKWNHGYVRGPTDADTEEKVRRIVASGGKPVAVTFEAFVERVATVMMADVLDEKSTHSSEASKESDQADPSESPHQGVHEIKVARSPSSEFRMLARRGDTSEKQQVTMELRDKIRALMRADPQVICLGEIRDERPQLGYSKDQLKAMLDLTQTDREPSLVGSAGVLRLIEQPEDSTSTGGDLPLMSRFLVHVSDVIHGREYGAGSDPDNGPDTGVDRDRSGG